MSRPRFLADHDLNEHLVYGAVRRELVIEFIRARDIGMHERPDAVVLAYAAEHQINYTILTVYHYVTEERERHKIKGAFMHYVAPVVIEEMLKDPGRLKLGGEEKALTVLFSNLYCIRPPPTLFVT